MRRFVTAVGALAALGLVAATGATAAPGESAEPTGMAPVAQTKYCPGALDSAGVRVAGVTMDVRDDVDYGLGGHTWARDDYRVTLTIYRVGWSLYCASVSTVGTFETQEGLSPGATSKVDDGRSGSIGGGYRTTLFVGSFRPSKPTSGHIGTYDYGCRGTSECPGRVNWLDFYFTNVVGFGKAWFLYHYNAGAHGVWANRSQASTGDISG
jgi:hypothetical protein